MTAPASLRNQRVHLQLMLWRHGWALPLGVLAVAAAVGLHWAVFEPVRTALIHASTELAQTSLTRARAADAIPMDEGQQLRVLRSKLGASPDATSLIRRLGELAEAEKIALAQAEYHEQRHPATGLLQVQVTQPVKASYPQVRRYVESVLRTLPNVSLDQIAARRENVGQAQLEVRLRWSIWIAP